MIPAPAPPGPKRRAGPLRIALFALIFFGIAVTEEVSNNVLPLTLRRMTEGFLLEFDLPFSIPWLAPDGHVAIGSALLIGLVLALNPFFGFIAQPLVGVFSDRIWTRVGRRAFFLIVAAPVVAACLVTIPFVTVLWHLVIVVVIYQFFQDVLWGSDNPLLADLFPSRQRGIVASALAFTYGIGQIFVTRFGLGWIDVHEKAHGGHLFGAPVYWWAAVFQVGFVMGLSFFLWEEKSDARGARPRLTLRRYITDFVNQPGLARLGCVNFLRAYMVTSATGFLVLYGTVTLGAEKADYSRVMGWLPLLGMAYVWILGAIVDRLRRNLVLTAAFAGCFFGYVIAWQAQSLITLAAASVVFGLCASAANIAFQSLVTDYYPRPMVGQLAGAINVFYATGRTLALVSVGAIVGIFNNDYRVAWIVAMALGAANFLLALTIRDPRERATTEPVSPG